MWGTDPSAACVMWGKPARSPQVTSEPHATQWRGTDQTSFLALCDCQPGPQFPIYKVWRLVLGGGIHTVTQGALGILKGEAEHPQFSRGTHPYLWICGSSGKGRLLGAQMSCFLRSCHITRRSVHRSDHASCDPRVGLWPLGPLHSAAGPVLCRCRRTMGVSCSYPLLGGGQAALPTCPCPQPCPWAQCEEGCMVWGGGGVPGKPICPIWD